jgi:hypothetical protein
VEYSFFGVFLKNPLTFCKSGPITGSGGYSGGGCRLPAGPAYGRHPDFSSLPPQFPGFQRPGVYPWLLAPRARPKGIDGVKERSFASLYRNYNAAQAEALGFGLIFALSLSLSLSLSLYFSSVFFLNTGGFSACPRPEFPFRKRAVSAFSARLDRGFWAPSRRFFSAAII